MIGFLDQLSVTYEALLYPPKRFLNRSSKNFQICSNTGWGCISVCGMGAGVGDGMSVTVGEGVIVAVCVAVGAIVGVAVGKSLR